MLLCLIAGDSIAVGVSQQFPQCVVNAKVGIPSGEVVGRAGDASVLIVSAGSNDPFNPKLEENLQAIRAKASGRVIWLVPRNAHAAAIVTKVARQHGDTAISFDAGRDGVHPRSYRELARRVWAYTQL